METTNLYEGFINSFVSIKCTDGCIIHGKTLSIDGYLNTAIEKALIYESGIDEPLELATVFVRGSNIEYIAANEGESDNKINE